MSEHDDAAAIEMVASMRQLAANFRAMYNGFLEEGFSKSEALTLVGEYVRGLAMGFAGAR